MTTVKRWFTSPASLFLLFSFAVVIGVSLVLYLNERHFTKPTVRITADNVDQLELIIHLRVYSTEARNRWGTEIQFSDDSRILSLSTLDGAMVWDVIEGRKLLHVKHDAICAESRCESLSRKNWPPPNSHAQDVSPNGKWLALGISRADFNDLQLWDIESGQMVRSFGRNSGLQALSFSPDGEYLIYTSQDEANACAGLCALHMPTNKYLRIGDADSDQLVSVQLDFTADGQTLIYSAPDGIHGFDLVTRERWMLIENPYPVISLDLSPDDSHIAVMNGIWGRTSVHTSVWEMSTHEILFEAPQHWLETSLMQVAFSPDGNLLITSSDAGSWVWDSRTGIQRHQLEMGNRWFQFHPEGQFVASKRSQNVFIHDPLTGNLIRTFNSDNYFIGDQVAFSPDGTMLVTSEGEIWGIPQ
ncbi:MAG: hypothetical protein CL610_24975 [Anaerolineaceae bacterium]|nr:hypothetical protein [Anaerolineaceae bacterium]